MLMDIGRQIRKQDLKENVTKKKVRYLASGQTGYTGTKVKRILL